MGFRKTRKSPGWLSLNVLRHKRLAAGDPGARDRGRPPGDSRGNAGRILDRQGTLHSKEGWRDSALFAAIDGHIPPSVETTLPRNGRLVKAPAVVWIQEGTINRR